MTTENSAEIALSQAPFTWKTLNAIAQTDFVPKPLRGNPAAILACVLTGRELGVGPMESLRVIDMIDGKPTPSAEWMVGRVFDAGHVIRAVEQTAESCTVEGIRYVDGTERARMEFTFDMTMAKRAGLATKNNWKNYPEAMLYWRAVAQLCRQFFPDVLRSLKYTPDELGDGDWTPPDPPDTNEAEVVPDDEVVDVEVVDEGYDEDDPTRPFA